mmetsp:Transcript_67753/g.151259  ORF Transcript_67753/g.151259 Transcript_67753/m.151259 type:complete len:200 (-) Transcript_67753:237-836(-)
MLTFESGLGVSKNRTAVQKPRLGAHSCARSGEDGLQYVGLESTHNGSGDRDWATRASEPGALKAEYIFSTSAFLGFEKPYHPSRGVCYHKERVRARAVRCKHSGLLQYGTQEAVTDGESRRRHCRQDDSLIGHGCYVRTQRCRRESLTAASQHGCPPMASLPDLATPRGQASAMPSANSAIRPEEVRDERVPDQPGEKS